MPEGDEFAMFGDAAGEVPSRGDVGLRPLKPGWAAHEDEYGREVRSRGHLNTRHLGIMRCNPKTVVVPLTESHCAI